MISYAAELAGSLPFGVEGSLQALSWVFSVTDSHVIELTRKCNFPKHLSQEIKELLSSLIFCWIISYVKLFHTLILWSKMKLHITTDFTVRPNLLFLSGMYSCFVVVFFHFSCISLQQENLSYASIAALVIPYLVCKNNLFHFWHQQTWTSS